MKKKKKIKDQNEHNPILKGKKVIFWQENINESNKTNWVLRGQEPCSLADILCRL